MLDEGEEFEGKCKSFHQGRRSEDGTRSPIHSWLVAIPFNPTSSALLRSIGSQTQIVTSSVISFL